MIKRVGIEGYKSFLSLNIELRPLTIIFGPNASGKSNLFDALKNAVQEYRKQIIITTHSPILPEYFDDKDLFVCGREKNQTTNKPFASGGT
jgi:predicted ATPase